MRSLSLREHAALLWVLSCLDDPVVAEVLYRQSLVVAAPDGPSTMVDLVVSSDAQPAVVADGPLPVRSVAFDENGQLLGEVMVWVSGGLLSALEYAWYSDEPPSCFPSPLALRLA